MYCCRCYRPQSGRSYPRRAQLARAPAPGPGICSAPTLLLLHAAPARQTVVVPVNDLGATGRSSFQATPQCRFDLPKISAVEMPDQLARAIV